MACPTAQLIDIEDEDNPKEKSSSIVSSNAKSEGATKLENIPTTSEVISTKPKAKLCGFLTKISSSGLLKSSRSRWFSFNPDACELLFYRSPDVEPSNNPPLGKIELRRASFNFTAEELKDNIFSITSKNVTHTLQACDRKTLLWWLQELQAERRAFNLRYTNDIEEHSEWHGTILGQSLFWVPNVTNTNPGLLDVCPESKNIAEGSKGGLQLNILPRIEHPPDSVGDKAAQKRNSMASPSGLSTLSNKIPGLVNLNAALSNAGESLKTQAQKLRPTNLVGRRMSDGSFESERPLSASSSASNLSNAGKDINHAAFISGLKETLQQKSEELHLVKTKLQTKEEAIEVLMMELEKYEQLKEARSQQRTFSKNDYKLRSEVINLKLTNEQLEQEKEKGSGREKELQERMSMLEEMLQAKDEIVMRLTNQMFDLETTLKTLKEDHDRLKAEKNEEFVILTPNQDLASLKDKVDGYVQQNKFLNNEILELANLRQLDAQRMRILHDKVQQQEAEHCQLHSKYLILLSEMNKPRSDSVGLAVAGSKVDTSDADRREMVKILIKEALSDADVKVVEGSAGQERRERYDQYGFSNVPEDDAESTLLTAASQLEKRSTDILQSLHQFKTSVAIKWQNYLTVNKEFQRSVEMKSLIRLGVPHELRPQVWSWLVNFQTQQIRQKMELDNSYYYRLVRSKEAQLPSKQIELDLLRTLPNNRHFSSLSSSGIDQLRRVLRAYSIHNPSIGYCQGLNRIVAVALLYLCEEEAFWCLVAIVECIMPNDYYSNTLTASQADQRVFRDLMAEKLPRLHRHLEGAGVDSSLITFNWLLCIFCDNVPPDTMFHIWDCLLYEGSKVLFRYGLAFFKYVEDEILQLTDYMAIFNFLRIMSHRMHDVRDLTRIAFYEMNPFPMKRINRLRQVYMEKVNAELRELDKIRKGFVSERRNVTRRDLDSDDE